MQTSYKHSQQVLRQLILNLSFIVLLCNTSCKQDDISPEETNAENLQFTKIVDLSKFAAAEAISISPNGKYLLFSYKGSIGATSYFFSSDGGESVEEIEPDADNLFINTNISNTGEFFAQASANGYGYAITDSGVKVRFSDYYSRFEKEVNGQYEDTGIEIHVDPFYFAGASGEKLGFFDYKNLIIGEYDASTNTFTEREVPDLNLHKIGPVGGQYEGKIKIAYSEGYFAFAKSQGVLIISPDNSVQYYLYPESGASYLNTTDLRLFGGYAYVNLNGKAYEAHGDAELKELDLAYPVVRTGNSLIGSGFIDGGERYESGIIRETDGKQEYLPLSFQEAYFLKVQVIRDKVYIGNKVYDQNTKTYSQSPIGEIIGIYHDENQTNAYTTTGMYSSTDGENWTERSSELFAPALVSKDANGLYHALDVFSHTYRSPSDGTVTYLFDQVGYTSSDGFAWEELSGSRRTDKPGLAPNVMTGDGLVFYKDTYLDISYQSVTTGYMSDDYGLNYEKIEDGSVHENFVLPTLKTSDDRLISAYFETTGELVFNICDSPAGDCSRTVTFTNIDQPESLYTIEDYMSMSDEDELVVSTYTGIYLSKPIK
ncbi:hypothetical protein [Marinoscillum pacificum]|uniref:hypothetical protein n=1 Tax=Marinoscillum pacificum TaxID=392723 RepID=UPI00215761F9|nr:hypothetical protein [Marinoscillum pacificum]